METPAEPKSGKKCPRCGEMAMEVDFKSGKARCGKCGYEIYFQKQ